jgi:hypothetical protein
MKKLLFLGTLVAIVMITANLAFCQCITIQDGGLQDVKGRPITLGYDDWGYNYEAHMFNGLLDNYSRPDVIATSGDELQMKWNDAWLSNKSCNGDFLLDRHFGYPSYKGSGAWLTNHQSGWVTDLRGKQRKYTYFCKIVAPPTEAVLDITVVTPYGEGMWYTDSTQSVAIGQCIWGEFAVTEEVYNDPTQGLHGRLYKKLAGPGLGLY